MIIASSTATVPTTASTAGPSCPSLCAGCGGAPKKQKKPPFLGIPPPNFPPRPPAGSPGSHHPAAGTRPQPAPRPPPARHLVVSFDENGKQKVLVDGFRGTHLAVGPRTGRLYLTGVKKGGQAPGVYIATMSGERADLAAEPVLEDEDIPGQLALNADES